MEVDLLLNMDGFDDNLNSIAPVFYPDSVGSTCSVSPGFSASDSGATVNPRSDLHPTASYHGRTQLCGNGPRSWPPEATIYPYGFHEDFPDYATTGTLYDAGLGHSSSNPDRSLMSTGSVPRSGEEAAWQMYLSASISESLTSLDLEISQDPCSLDLAYPHHNLTHERFSEFPETLESSYQGTQMMNDGRQQIFSPLPLVLPQLENIQPALLSMPSTQKPDDSLLFAQSDYYAKAGERATVYPSDVIDPKFDTGISLSPSRGRSPTITKLVNDSSTRPRRGLTGWGDTTNHLAIPAFGSMSKSPNSVLSPPLSSSTGGSLKRLRPASDESPPLLKRASKTRRITVESAAIDTEDDGAADIGGDDSDSDDYMPSRSTSLNPSQRSISPSFTFQRETGATSTSSTKRRSKKGKAKGSAALALAIVSQMSSTGRHNIDLASTRYGVRRRKNHPIPLPIPVPNLNKKSRGRKVPYMNDPTVTKIKTEDVEQEALGKGDDDVDDDDDDDDESGQDRSKSSSSRSRRKKREMSKTPSGENRSFICVISGCGKCFVRSEHLKRHVRSIHTHDKRESPLFSYIFLFSFNHADTYYQLILAPLKDVTSLLVDVITLDNMSAFIYSLDYLFF